MRQIARVPLLALTFVLSVFVALAVHLRGIDPNRIDAETGAVRDA